MAAVSDPNTLGKIHLLQGLSPRELLRLNELLHSRTYPPNTTIIDAEQPGEIAYMILSGTVRIHVEQPDGNDVVLAILGPGEIVGEMSLVDSLNRSASAVTQEESALLWIDRATFHECLRSMPTMAFNLTRILSRRLRIANAQIQSLATMDVYGRVARQLLAFAKEYGQPVTDGTLIPFRLTQNDVAGMVGASRVRVNQVLVNYKRRRLLSVDRNYRITIHNSEALAQRCQ